MDRPIGKLIIIIFVVILISAALRADEVQFTLGSSVKHHFKIPGLEWNEGGGNSAKGITYYLEFDNTHSVGVAHVRFLNSFYVPTKATGIVYRYKKELTNTIDTFVELYGVYQEGYYGEWDKVRGYDPNTDNKFITPLAMAGLTWWFHKDMGLTIKGIGTSDTLHVKTFSITARF